MCGSQDSSNPVTYVNSLLVTVETCCPLILVITLLLVVKHSTTLNVVTGLVVVLVSLTTDTKLFGCDMFCWLCSTLGDCITGVTDNCWGEWLTVIVEDEDDRTLGAKSTVVKCT